MKSHYLPCTYSRNFSSDITSREGKIYVQDREHERNYTVKVEKIGFKKGWNSEQLEKNFLSDIDGKCGAELKNVINECKFPSCKSSQNNFLKFVACLESRNPMTRKTFKFIRSKLEQYVFSILNEEFKPNIPKDICNKYITNMSQLLQQINDEKETLEYKDKEIKKYCEMACNSLRGHTCYIRRSQYPFLLGDYPFVKLHDNNFKSSFGIEYCDLIYLPLARFIYAVFRKPSCRYYESHSERLVQKINEIIVASNNLIYCHPEDNNMLLECNKPKLIRQLSDSATEEETDCYFRITNKLTLRSDLINLKHYIEKNYEQLQLEKQINLYYDSLSHQEKINGNRNGIT